MGLDSRLTWSVIYDFCFGYRVEGSIGHPEVADDFTNVSYLNTYVLEEVISGSSLNDHYFSGYTLARKSSMEKPDRSDWVPTSL